MILYLTSDPGGVWDDNGKNKSKAFKKKNSFLSNLSNDLSMDGINHNEDSRNSSLKCLLIASDPQDTFHNDSYKEAISASFKKAHIFFDQIDMCDNRHPEYVDKLSDYTLVFLLGGRLPVQNAFFKKIKLKDKISEYGGTVVAISAGTMNCAKKVYLMPEEVSDLSIPSEKRFCPGLGLTDYQIVPHYQWLKTITLNGAKVIDDIVLTDSIGHEFVALTDGSYFRINTKDSTSELFGQAYRISNGKIILFTTS